MSISGRNNYTVSNDDRRENTLTFETDLLETDLEEGQSDLVPDHLEQTLPVAVPLKDDPQSGYSSDEGTDSEYTPSDVSSNISSNVVSEDDEGDPYFPDFSDFSSDDDSDASDSPPPLPNPIPYHDHSPQKNAKQNDQPVSNGSEETDSDSELFSGPHHANYQRFLKLTRFLKAQGLIRLDDQESEQLAQFKPLGNVSPDVKYYFDESQKSLDCARTFLHAFWQDKTNIELVVEQQRKKISEYSRGNAVPPSCISFIVADLKNTGKTYCFIAISSISFFDKRLIEQLIVTIKNLNKTNPSIHFELIGGGIENFNELLKAVSPATNPNKYRKPCSEKYIGSLLAKLFSLLGESLAVEGIVNCAFFPWKADKELDNKLVTPMKFDRALALNEQNSNLETRVFSCCPDCQKNKERVLTVLRSAQLSADPTVWETFNSDLLADMQNTTEGALRGTSPLDHSLLSVSPNSTLRLLTPCSMFNKRQQKPTSQPIENSLQAGEGIKPPVELTLISCVS